MNTSRQKFSLDTPLTLKENKRLFGLNTFEVSNFVHKIPAEKKFSLFTEG